MRPVHEVSEACWHHYRRGRWVLYPLAAVALFWPFIVFGHDALASDGWLHTSLRPYLLNNLIVLVALAALWLPVLPGVFLAGWLFEQLGRGSPALACPNCRRTLIRQVDRVIATRACLRCKQQILFDPFPPEPPVLTRVEAEARASRWRRFRRVNIWLIFPPFLVSLGVIALPDEAIPPNDGSIRDAIEAAAVCFILAWSSYSFFWMWRHRPPNINCPRCGSSHDPDFVARFGGCGWCSQPLVADTPIESAGVADKPPSE